MARPTTPETRVKVAAFSMPVIDEQILRELSPNRGDFSRHLKIATRDYLKRMANEGKLPAEKIAHLTAS